MIRRIFSSARNVFIAIEVSYQDQLRKFKKQAISIFGTGAIDVFGFTTALGQVVDDIEKFDANLLIYFLLSGLLLLSIFFLMGSYWTWEFLKYDFDLPINPIYEDLPSDEDSSSK